MYEIDVEEFNGAIAPPKLSFASPAVVPVLMTAIAEGMAAGFGRKIGEGLGEAVAGAVLKALGLKEADAARVTEEKIRQMLNEFVARLEEYIRGQFQYQRVVDIENATAKSAAMLATYAMNGNGQFWVEAVNEAVAAEMMALRMVEKESAGYLAIYAAAALNRIVLLCSDPMTFAKAERIRSLQAHIAFVEDFIADTLYRMYNLIEAETQSVVQNAKTGGMSTAESFCGQTEGYYCYWVHPKHGRICGFPRGIGAGKEKEAYGMLVRLRSDYLKSAKAAVGETPEAVLKSLRKTLEDLEGLLKD